MERDNNYIEIKSIFKENFIGIEEIRSISPQIQFLAVENLEYKEITFPIEFLREKCLDYVLFYYHPFMSNKSNLTINNLKSYFKNVKFSDVVFYNQDWYENEKFANQTVQKEGWYLLKKAVIESSRGICPDSNKIEISYPSALLCTYIFFLNYLINNTILWEHDYIWCSDFDSNGDSIYVGRYKDINKINKEGFSIHRHLKIKSNYGFIDLI
jgi:hypothetical protein